MVFLLLGQSNMVGSGRTADLGYDVRWPSSVRYFDRQGEKDVLQGNRFGPEISMATRFAQVFAGREVRLLKVAVGGTSLLDWAPQWDSTRAAITGNAWAGPMYTHAIEALDSLRAAEEVYVAAAFWMQGERDARFADVGRDYYGRLDTLITSLRSDVGRDDLPFILGIVNPPPERYPAEEDVRAAQRRAAEEIAGVVLVDTDDISKWDDRLHYDSEGNLELGRRFAEAYLGFSGLDPH